MTMTEPKPARRIRFAAAILAATVALAPGVARADYWVYCVHGTLRVESRPPADVTRSHIAGAVCSFGQFRHVSDARGFAQRNFGGEGRSCSCR
jgi:hypothetical protein